MKRKEKKSGWGYKDKNEAEAAADRDWPVGIKTLQLVQNMSTWPPKTKEDFRWHILFNIITVMMRDINNDIDTAHWLRIQKNIECSVNEYFK